MNRIRIDRRNVGATFGVALFCVVAALLATPRQAQAISYGGPDGDGHPFVGSIVVDVPGSGLIQWCTGTLIDNQVFLTASHCTAGLDRFVAANPGTMVFVTFDPTISEGGTFYTGQWYTNPNFGGGGQADPGDVAVIVLDQAPGITPARLPPAGILDQMKRRGALKRTRFTAVGYGTVRETNRTAFQAILRNRDRNRVEQSFLSLTKAWITLAMNLSTGNGGTCYGDSGGPHFIHLNGEETDIVVSITVTGDAFCKATDKTYRVDTQSARDFLANFVTLP